MVSHFALTAVVLTWLSAATAPTANTDQSAYGTTETYRQVLVIESRSDSSKLPIPQLAPVYDGRKWALSTRWDDSNPNALNIRRKMLENGIRGTFYLNSRKPEPQQQSLAHKLTDQGKCSIGGHSVSHPHLPKLPANETFYQLIANRIALECLTDRPVNSLAFPFGGYQDRERPEVLQGVTESFLRAGYHHCVYIYFVTKNPFLPPGMVSTGLQVIPGDRKVDAKTFWARMEKIRQSSSTYQKTSHCIFLGVHPWQQGEELERLGQVMKKLRNWDDFWHCTQTEYAAFVKQRRNTIVKKLDSGQFEITRPCAFQLGSDDPLTLVFDGQEVKSASVDGIACTVRHADDKTFVNVPHNSRFGIPKTIDATAEGTAKKFPGLISSLTFDPETGKAAFTLKNATAVQLTDLLLTLSVPPAFEPGISQWKRPQLAVGDNWSVATTVSPRRTGNYWRGGRYYVAAQLDFVLDGKRGRLFTTCTVAADTPSE